MVARNIYNIRDYLRLPQKERDALLFKGTVYDGMDFVRLDDWKYFDAISYASPRFKFENGDIIVF